MPCVFFEKFNEIIVIVDTNGHGNFRQRQIGTQNQRSRLLDALFVDVMFRRGIRFRLEDGIQHFFGNVEIIAQEFNA